MTNGEVAVFARSEARATKQTHKTINYEKHYNNNVRKQYKIFNLVSNEIANDERRDIKAIFSILFIPNI